MYEVLKGHNFNEACTWQEPPNCSSCSFSGALGHQIHPFCSGTATLFAASSVAPGFVWWGHSSITGPGGSHLDIRWVKRTGLVSMMRLTICWFLFTVKEGKVGKRVSHLFCWVFLGGNVVLGMVLTSQVKKKKRKRDFLLNMWWFDMWQLLLLMEESPHHPARIKLFIHWARLPDKPLNIDRLAGFLNHQQ